jgi:glutathione S-transferase
VCCLFLACCGKTSLILGLGYRCVGGIIRNGRKNSIRFGEVISMAARHYRLVIGNKNTSSWSLRPWLLMKRCAIEFEEVNINLRDPNRSALIKAHSPAGKVPVLWAGDLLVWDSLAIMEYLADKHPDLGIWPGDMTARAMARCISAEMHSGFQALREHCPMSILSTSRQQDVHQDAVAADIARVVAIWSDTRKRFGKSGRFLFSKFTAADAMYAPVASRLKTYVGDLSAYGDDGTARAYVDTIFSMPEMHAWTEGAQAEMA